MTLNSQHQLKYNGNLKWLVNNTILYVIHGSRSYGTFTKSSDYDYKGVAITPKEYRNGYLLKFEQAESREPDSVIYNLNKFISLAADCNPNIIEVLWTDEKNIVIKTDIGKKLVDNRQLFLSQKALHTFRGYSVYGSIHTIY